MIILSEYLGNNRVSPIDVEASLGVIGGEA